MTSPRWISRLKEAIHLVLTGQKSFPVPICDKTRNILMQYDAKLQQPYSSVLSPQKSRVFANNYLNLGEVNVIGFDLDYTLVPYTVELQHLIFSIARDTLVTSYDYPVELKTCFFDPEFAIRGLSVDSRYGILVKLSYLQRVQRRYSYKGKRQITAEEMKESYGTSRHISFEDLSTLRPLNDLFSMSEACLIADAMEIFEHRKLHKGEQYSPIAIIDDVQAAIRDVHVSGAMHNAVIHDFDRYAKYNPKLMELLVHFRQAGKKIFLCTNSGYKYADKALSYAMGLPSSQVPSALKTNDWRELFDLIICSANKPGFFSSKKPFRKWNTELDHPIPHPVTDINRNEAYINGSVNAMHKFKTWSDREILYVGDNLGTDLVEAKKRFGWHTALIINELDREVDIQSDDLFHELHYVRSTLRNLLTDLQLAMYSTQELAKTSRALAIIGKEEENKKLKLADYAHHLAMKAPFSDNYQENYELLKLFEDELHSVNTELSLLFNPQFGSMFRTDGHTSLYAYAIRRYADLYMSEVGHFLHYSPTHRFYPPHALHMAHDPV